MVIVAVVVASALAACTGSAPLALPAETREAMASPSPVALPRGGTVRVAYADVPATWSGHHSGDTAATDLAQLWSLPFFRYDPDGQLVPGLVEDVAFPEVGDGWAVELELAEGAWTDGSPVTARDAVATVEVMRERAPGAWSSLTAAEAVGEHTLRLHFDAPMGRWADLLAGPPGVLPTAVLEAEGIDAYAQELPVVGGTFRLATFEPGRSAEFVAHPEGPLGPPRLERIDVLFVPSYETALGLLDRGEVDLVLGHLALNPVARAEGLDGVRASAPLGGTTVSLEWLETGSLGGSAALRQRAASALDLAELVAGLLPTIGEPASSPVPGVAGPFDAASGDGPVPSEHLREEVVVLVPRWHEALGFTSRAIQRDLASAGAVARLVTVATPELLDPVDPHDGALRMRRDTPRPSLGPAGDAVVPGPPEVLERELAPTFEELAEAAWEVPLYRVGVAHAWREGVTGVEPSSWPGLAFWNVGEWDIEAAS